MSNEKPRLVRGFVHKDGDQSLTEGFVGDSLVYE